MPDFGFLSDLHLDHIRTGDAGVNDFIQRNKKLKLDGLLVTGDISTSYGIVRHLQMMSDGFDIPLYFILGNHDFWGSSVETVRKNVTTLCSTSERLKYLSIVPYVPISEMTAVVGHDGWYDGLNGAGTNSRMFMNDWGQTYEFKDAFRGAKSFKDIDIKAVAAVAQGLAMQGVNHLHDSIKAAARNFQDIIVCTHVPPWENAHMYNGRTGDPEGGPWFTSKLMGILLERAADAHPHVNFTVLCGHTHGKCTYQPRHNMICHTAGAVYGDPAISSVISMR